MGYPVKKCLACNYNAEYRVDGNDFCEACSNKVAYRRTNLERIYETEDILNGR